MLIASLNTSAHQGSVGWISTSANDGSIVGDEVVEQFAEITAPAQLGHAETLLERLNTVLSYGGYRLRDIGLIVFCRGPGTFTGLRIGLSTVKGIAMATGAHIVSLCSLECIALSCCVEGKVAAVIDARRNELFGALFNVTTNDSRPQCQTIVEPRVGPADAIIEVIEQSLGKETVFLAGDGAVRYGCDFANRLAPRLEILPRERWYPSTYQMALAGLERLRTQGPDDLNTLVPSYLRKPDARLPKN